MVLVLIATPLASLAVLVLAMIYCILVITIQVVKLFCMGGEGFDTADFSERTSGGVEFAFAGNEFEQVIGSSIIDDIFFSNDNANNVLLEERVKTR